MNQAPDPFHPALNADSPDEGLLLYTGNPITDEELKAFIDSSAKTLLGSPEGILRVEPLSAQTASLNPRSFHGDGIHGIANCCEQFDSSRGLMTFKPCTFDAKASWSNQSCLVFWIDIDRAQRGQVLYTILVRAEASQQGKFEIVFQSRPVQTVSVPREGDQFFVYAFTCGDSDVAFVSIYGNVRWSFKSAVLTTEAA